MAKRKSISKKVRFEVFKRDSFTCQYCGSKAPDVVLHVDHVDPVSRGGGNDPLNLITSCVDCNGGKGATPLDDNAALSKQLQQLAELSERRQQLKMMLDWRKGLKEIDELHLEAARDHFSETFVGWSITTDSAIAHIRKMVRQFGLPLVMEAIDIAKEQYASVVDRDSATLAFSKLGGICNYRSKPDESGIRYARGILRNRLNYVHEGIAITLLRQAREAGADDETVKAMAKDARSWRDWQDDMHDLIEGRRP
jgi:hypothetical protein